VDVKSDVKYSRSSKDTLYRYVCVCVCPSRGAKRNNKGLPHTRPGYVKIHKGRLVNIPTVMCLVREHSQ